MVLREPDTRSADRLATGTETREPLGTRIRRTSSRFRADYW